MTTPNIAFIEAIAAQHLNTDNQEKITSYVRELLDCKRARNAVTNFLGVCTSYKLDKSLPADLKANYGYRQEVAALLTVSNYDKFVKAIASGMQATSAADLVGLHQYRRWMNVLDDRNQAVSAGGELLRVERAAYLALREDVRRSRALYAFRLICEVIDNPSTLSRNIWLFRQCCANV